MNAVFLVLLYTKYDTLEFASYTLRVLCKCSMNLMKRTIIVKQLVKREIKQIAQMTAEQNIRYIFELRLC
jgi:hypothetical protein